MESVFSGISARDLVLNSPLFTGLDQMSLERLLDSLESLKLVSGETLFEEGAEGKALYLIASGRLSIHITLQEKGILKQRIVGYLGRGEVVGEMSLITGEPRSASLVAVRDTILFRLKSEDFDTLFMQNPLAMKRLMAILVNRLKATTRATQQAETAAAFTVIPLGSTQKSWEMMKNLQHSFQQRGFSTRLVHKKEALKDLGIQEIQEGTGLASWLSEQEDKVDFIFYDASPQEGALWSDYCHRQSDAVIYLGEGDASPISPPIKISHTLSEELVLLYPNDTVLPEKTSAWTSYYPKSRYHHLRHGNTKDLDRLTRILTGKAIGVVLGGGGARGFAHIGALRAFDDLGIPIDMIGGTSMGSLVAAARAIGWSNAHTSDIFRAFFLTSGGLQEYTFPFFSLIKGDKIKQALEKLLQKTTIEDLWLPFFCISTNLTNAEKTVHQSGSLLKALLSSFAIPGVLPPVLEGGHILVDGAFLDNLPIRPMRQRCSGKIIAINVSPVEDESVQTTCEALPQPGATFMNKINPFSHEEVPPGILSLLMRATTIGSVHQLESLRKEVDVFIEPPISHFSLMDWEKIEEIMEVGYQETLSKLQNASFSF